MRVSGTGAKLFKLDEISLCVIGIIMSKLNSRF